MEIVYIYSFLFFFLIFDSNVIIEFVITYLTYIFLRF